jgi:hypothetical protein
LPDCVILTMWRDTQRPMMPSNGKKSGPW